MDFNEAGVDYQMHFQKIASLPGGGMKTSGRKIYLNLREKVLRSYRDKTRAESILDNSYGCMHHFETYLHQMTNFLSHVDAIDHIADLQLSADYPIVIIDKKSEAINFETHGWAALRPPLVIGLVARGVEYDFALLLLSSVATLDRIAAFVSQEILGEELNFYHLRRQIGGSNDARARKIAAAIDQALSAIEHVLITTDQNRKSLRNRIAHLASMPELIDGILTIHLLEDGKSIVFDHDLAGFPLFATAYNIGHAMPFLAISMISAMLVFDAQGDTLDGTEDLQKIIFDDFVPEWTNPSINRHSFTAAVGSGTAVTFFKPGLHSTKVENVILSNKIFDHARSSKKGG